MSKVSISQAAKMAKISRSTLYNKYINPGLISVEVVEDKKVIDMSELLRVFGNNVQADTNTVQDNTPQDINSTSKDKLISILEQQLQESKEREKEAQDREAWLKAQIDELRQQQNNLLENKNQKQRKKFFGLI